MICIPGEKPSTLFLFAIVSGLGGLRTCVVLRITFSTVIPTTSKDLAPIIPAISFNTSIVPFTIISKGQFAKSSSFSYALSKTASFHPYEILFSFVQISIGLCVNCRQYHECYVKGCQNEKGGFHFDPNVDVFDPLFIN